MQLSLNGEDFAQIVIGAAVLAVPVSFSEEAWGTAIELPLPNLLLLFLLSIGFLALYSYQSMFQASVKKRVFVFVFRIFLAYLLTAIVVAVVLLSLNKLPLFDAPVIALKRIILVAMPASMGAIVVDSFDKE